MDLPKLNNTPARHPDLCLSISTSLLQTLTNTILTTTTKEGPDTTTTTTANTLILSVGSGSGLLEAHLQKHLIISQAPSPAAPTSFTVKGVEVRSSSSSSSSSSTSAAAAAVNKYLPADQATTVRGTWEVCPLIAAADTLMFVYPRDPRLVSRYLEAAAGRQQHAASALPLRVVLWLGPRADWEEVFAGCFRGLDGFGGVEVIEGEGAGVAEFEMVAVVRRRRQS